MLHRVSLIQHRSVHRVSLSLHRVPLSHHRRDFSLEHLRPLVPHSRCRREVTLEHLHPLADFILHRHGLFQRLPDSHGVSLERLDPLRLLDGDLGAPHQRVPVDHRELLHLIDRSLLDHRPHLFPHPRGPPVHHRHQCRAVHRACLRCRGWLSLGVGGDDIVEAGRSLRRPQDSTERVTGLLLRPPQPALRGRGGELRGILRRGFRLGNLLPFLFFGVGIRIVEFFHVRAPLTHANPFRLGHR